MSSRCWKRRVSGPSKAEGRSREGDRDPEGGRRECLRGRRGQRPRGKGDRDSGQKLKPRPGKTHRTTDWGTGAPCHQESQNKGPRRPLPQFPTTPIRGGAGQRGNLPSSPRPTPSHPSPCAVGSSPAQVPSDFPEAGNRGKLFPIQIPPPWRLHVFHSFPRTLESGLPSPSSFGPWNPGQDKDPGRTRWRCRVQDPRRPKSQPSSCPCGQTKGRRSRLSKVPLISRPRPQTSGETRPKIQKAP